MSVRESFVDRFGEEEAVRIENAARKHLDPEVMARNRGSDEFKFFFLAAIGYECVGRYRESHGIEASEEDLKDWARWDGDLGNHDGDIPDYLALFVGAYEPWVNPDQMTVKFTREDEHGPGTDQGTETEGE